MLESFSDSYGKQKVSATKYGLFHYALTAEPHNFQVHITHKHTKIQEMHGV